MNTKDILIKDYYYNLPQERIAKYPLKERDTSKLLLYKQGNISEHKFKDIANLLPDDGIIVRNNTKVIRARLIFNKSTGAKVEVFCLEPSNPDSYELALSSKNECSWHCMLGNSKRWKLGAEPLSQEIIISGQTIVLHVKRIAEAEVRFYWDNPNFTFSEIIDSLGVLPIPPYLNRETEQEDNKTYQTVYALRKGSVAAPTAGLHFTEKVNADIKAKGIDVVEVTLHVGAGTFMPVKTESIGEHNMHSELVIIDRSTINILEEYLDKRIIAVGTTSVRTLESIYQLARLINVKAVINPNNIEVKQWEAYNESIPYISREHAFRVILDFMDKHSLGELIFHTQIMIAPGYKFNLVDGMITNFHQPNSTLLLLISAFTNGRWQEIYDYALKNDFRFLSYGDSSLLLPNE